MKKALQWIFLTNIGKLITCFILSALCLAIANYIDPDKTIYNVLIYMAIGFFVIFPLPWFLIGMVYAWIINPLRDRKEKKQFKLNLNTFNVWKDKMIYLGFKNEDYDILLRNYQVRFKDTNLDLFQTPEQLSTYFGIVEK